VICSDEDRMVEQFCALVFFVANYPCTKFGYDQSRLGEGVNFTVLP